MVLVMYAESVDPLVAVLDLESNVSCLSNLSFCDLFLNVADPMFSIMGSATLRR